MSTPKSPAETSLTLPADPSRAMQEMVVLIDAMRKIYIEENDILRASKTREFMDLQPRKLETTRNYHDGISQMAARREDFKSVAPELKELFRMKQNEFRIVAEENLESLDRMRRSVNRLNDRIMSAARKAIERDGVNYGAHGKMKNSNNSIPVTLNESA